MTLFLRCGKLPTVNMTDLERLLEPFWQTDDGMTAVERAEAYGIDLSLITENLRLTPEERVDQNQAALEFAKSLRTARS